MRLDAEPLLADRRFVSRAGSLLNEVPHLAPIQQQRRLKHSRYENTQFIFRLAATPEPSTPMRMPVDLLLQRAMTAAMRRANTLNDRREIQMLPRELASLNQSTLADWRYCDMRYGTTLDLFTPPRRRPR